MAQPRHVRTVSVGRLADDVTLGELVAEPLGHRAPDLDPQTAQALGNRDHAHGAPPGKREAPTGRDPTVRGLRSRASRPGEPACEPPLPGKPVLPRTLSGVYAQALKR